ncbi:MAG: hypothetical protein ACI9U2_004103 [Bradymonadia bacterium]|jgi:hypothetical protein
MKRAVLKARIEAAKAERRRRRRKRVIKLILFLILLWLLLRRCDTGLIFVPLVVPVPGAAKSVATAGPPSTAPATRRARAKPKRLRRVKTEPRALYAPKPAGPAPWLAALRLQVAARSPRLARCFEGLGEPGALTWTMSLDPASGVASDHAFEPRSGGALNKKARACLTAVLSAPPFSLGVEGVEGAARTRVSLVIEF